MARFGKGYEHINDAAAAALMLLARRPNVENQEYMGVLMRDPISEMYYRSDFQTQGLRNKSGWSGYPDFPIAGLVHNHPLERNGIAPTTMFSDTDIEQAKGQPTFVTAIQKHERPKERKFTGETRVVRGKGRSDRTLVGESEPFLAQFPIQELLQHIARRNPLVAAAIQDQQYIPQQPINDGSLPAPKTARRVSPIGK